MAKRKLMGLTAAMLAAVSIVAPGAAMAAPIHNFNCTGAEASLGGYTYFVNWRQGVLTTGVCYADSGSMVTGHRAIELHSYNNAGEFEYSRPDIVRGRRSFHKNESIPLEPGTGILKVTIY